MRYITSRFTYLLTYLHLCAREAEHVWHTHIYVDEYITLWHQQ